MDDQVTMCVCHTFTYVQKEPELIRQIHSLGMDINGYAINVFHNKVWSAIDGVSGIDQACNRRMVERGQQLAFLQKTVMPGRPVHIGTQDLDGNMLLNLAITALGQIDGS